MAEETLESVTAGLETLTTELTTLSANLVETKKAQEDKWAELKQGYDGASADLTETKAAVDKTAAEYAELTSMVQQLEKAVDSVKKDLEAPIYRSEKDLEDVDRKNAIELQRRIHVFKAGTDLDFEPDLDNLVDVSAYRRVCRKMMSVGIESRSKVIRDLTDVERKAFDAASLDSAFFSPEMLGMEVDCEVECAELLSLYGQETVTRTNYMYPRVNSYGDIGMYDCDAKCDAEMGPPGNIQYLQGQTYDFRGVFCFQRKVLAEANYDLLNFMFRAAARSHRINRNRALITGDGINEPLGWLTADLFTKLETANAAFTHQDYRRFISSAPVEYGSVVATMHQNVFAYLASAVDNSGRFIFGDGSMTFSPDEANERLRISNCLPDPTDGGTLGNSANPFVAGSFICAAGNWDMAYKSVSKKGLFMEQFEGGSSAWCVKYQFGAEDGGFVACAPAARTLVIGA